jgi:hypothetical protein
LAQSSAPAKAARQRLRFEIIWTGRLRTLIAVLKAEPPPRAMGYKVEKSNRETQTCPIRTAGSSGTN